MNIKKQYRAETGHRVILDYSSLLKYIIYLEGRIKKESERADAACDKLTEDELIKLGG